MLVGGFCLPAGLWVIRSRDVMLWPKLFQEVSEGLINEMRPFVTYDHPWSPKAREDDLMKHHTACLALAALLGRASTNFER